jgi:hypothetical protein
MKKSVVLLIGLMLLASCASTGERKTAEVTHAKAGFLEGYYEKLGPGPKDGAKLRWLKPGVDFSRYEEFMIDSVVFFLADESEYKGIDGNEMKELTDAFNLELANALKDKYPIVSEPGPDVIRVRIAITNVKLSKPVLSGVTSIIPIGLGVSLIKKGATGAWTGSGEIGVELLAIDTMTNEVIAAAQDERTAGFTQRFSTLGSAKDAFKFWAGRVRTFFDNVRDAKK